MRIDTTRRCHQSRVQEARISATMANSQIKCARLLKYIINKEVLLKTLKCGTQYKKYLLWIGLLINQLFQKDGDLNAYKKSSNKFKKLHRMGNQQL